MLKLKSSQYVGFTDVNVRRILGYLENEKSEGEDKLRRISQVQREIDLVFRGTPNASIQDMRAQTGIWESIEEILGDDHWTLEWLYNLPGGGML